MGKKAVKFASTSKQKDATTPLKHTSSIPPKRLQAFSSVATSTKNRLHKIDSGRCLITFEKRPTTSQQVAHIVTRKSSVKLVKGLEKMWRYSPLNLDSTQNLVTLRADWHSSYNHGDWTFSPSKSILERILKHKNTNFEEPYPGFDSDDKQNFVFIPLPNLHRRYILRQMRAFDDDNEEQEQEDEEEEQEEQEQEEQEQEEQEQVEQEGEEEKEGEQGEQAVKIENGNAILHIKPFSKFPLLEHHAHPYFAIYNALPKLRTHLPELQQEHRDLYLLMAKIELKWISISQLPKSSKLQKRKRHSHKSSDDDDEEDDAPDDDESRGRATKRQKLPGTGERKIYQTRSKTKGKGKTRALQEKMQAKPQPEESRYRTPSPSQLYADTLYGDISNVNAWVASVAAAGPPEVVDETVIWLDKEPVRPPIKKWNRWHVPYKQPKQRAKFCSSDWPMYFYSYALWMPRFKK